MKYFKQEKNGVLLGYATTNSDVIPEGNIEITKEEYKKLAEQQLQKYLAEEKAKQANNK